MQKNIDQQDQHLAIIAAMPQEMALLRENITHCKENHIAGITIYQGILENRPVLLMQCGIGKVNAALGTTLLLHHFNAQAIINTGSAGALASYLTVGDVIVADKLIHHDVDLTAFGYQIGQMAQMPAFYTPDPSLAIAAQEAAKAFPQSSILSGLIVSGDQFIHGGDKLTHIQKQFPTALAVEMEAAAIAQVCFRFSVPYTIIRAVSDNANGDASIDFETFLDQASTHSANMVRQLLRIL